MTESIEQAVAKAPWSRAASTALVILSTFFVGCGQTEPIAIERIDEWFDSRLLWGALLAALAGGLVAFFHLYRLRYRLGELSLNRRARKIVWLWTLGFAVASAISILIDVRFFPYGRAVSWAQVFNEVFLNYRALIVLAIAWVVFFVVIVITTRLRPGCSCQYAILKWPSMR